MDPNAPKVEPPEMVKQMMRPISSDFDKPIRVEGVSF